MSLRPVLLALAAAMTLTACVAPPAARPRPAAPAPVAVPVPAPLPVTGAFAGPRDRLATARSFIAVVEAVEPVAEGECLRRSPQLNCDFRIVVDDRPRMPPNAFQTVDDQGRPIIAFTLALINEVRNGDELAFVMAHEAAHHIAGHLTRQRQNATLGATVFGQLAGTVGRADAESIRVAQELGAAVGARSYSKEFELEADALGTVIAARAGFDPVRGADFFFRIPDPGNRFLGSHPPNADRVALVRRTAAGLGF